MRQRVTLILILLGGLLMALAVAKWYRESASRRAQVPITKELIVYAYSTFFGPAGPGPLLKADFEKSCACKIQFVAAGEGEILLERLRLAASPVDLVIGLDQLSAPAALKKTGWRSTEIGGRIPWRQEVLAAGRQVPAEPLLPYDWAPMAFVYRRSEGPPPGDWAHLLRPEYRGHLVIPNPRTSTPGLQFLRWVYEGLGTAEAIAYLEKLKANGARYVDSWPMAYGLFQQKQARLVFSYLTSPFFHWLEENNQDYQAAIFASGHVTQIELMGIPEKCRECKLAEQFAEYLLSPGAQVVLQRRNYMLSVRRDLSELAPWTNLPEVKILPSAEEDFADFFAVREKLVQAALP